MNTNEALQAIVDHDRSIVDRAGDVPASIVPEIERALPELDDDARRLAIRFLAAQDAPGAGELLLKMAADSDPMIASSAVDAVYQLPKAPPVDAILKASATVEERVPRGRLYLLVGKTGDPKDLPKLRAATSRETSRAARDAQVAAVKLGGVDERKAFIDRIRKASADDALEIIEHLQYVGDPKLARPLLEWLPNQEPVLRLGNDKHGTMARMCDVAVSAAESLGVQIPGVPPQLTNYDENVLAAAKAALTALPE